ncbi:signal peptidase I [Romboutsia maritimum]|uniref:Signal peptidase I n=1 Tax=Romboutsia maritimum TaxID=2020948 RepID=A0A255I114_9FIRM|nr:signal peptidase I [Romboutsia maritimum]RDY24102.1 signal peptidase I [Romboutsia maritimum]
MSSKLKKEIYEWIKTIGVALVVAVVIIQFIRPTIVNGESMYPTLEDKDYLIINRMAYKLGDPTKGDIVVFGTDLEQENGDKKDLVKRVIAVEGDHLKIKDSKIYINGKLIDEPYIHDNYTTGDIDTDIPKGKIFAMGDNRENSMDSRMSQVGLVDEHDLVGKVMIRLFPFNSIGTVK